MVGLEGGMSMGIDPGVFESIMSRLDSLEKRPVSSSGVASVSNSELVLLKQQFETVKQAMIQVKGSSTNLVKENVSLKTQLENMRKELTETKELLSALQNLTMDNSQKIMDLSMGMDYPGTFEDQMLDDGEQMIEMDDCTNLEDLEDENETVGTDLKQLIESELNNIGI
jgi:hypothetical protein